MIPIERATWGRVTCGSTTGRLPTGPRARCLRLNVFSSLIGPLSYPGRKVWLHDFEWSVGLGRSGR